VLGAYPAGVSDDASPPIACTLAADALAARIGEWHALVATATAREPIDGGWRLRFPPGTDVVALTEAEQACCAFFDFAVLRAPNEVVLEVRAPVEAARIVDELLATR
jgi:hypothetical protein